MNINLRQVFAYALDAVRASVGLIASVVSFLAMSADTSPADEELTSSIRGGDLNYRTGKLDDGTDPHGWYERD